MQVPMWVVFFMAYVIYYIYQRFQYQYKNKMVLMEKVDIWREINTMLKEYGDKYQGGASMRTFHIYKVPKQLKYIHMDDGYKRIIEKLYFMRNFNKYDLLHCIIMTETFLKYHYNVVIGKYDMSLYYSYLVDIRKEMVNSIYSMIYHVHNVSTIVSIPNIHHHIRNRAREMAALTKRYMNVLRYVDMDKGYAISDSIDDTVKPMDESLHNTWDVFV